MTRLHIHIGHHFFGAGNLGDDLMVAGFLEAVRQYQPEVRLTCAVAQGLSSQRLRFPEIEWLPYDNHVRRECVQACDIWLGLGDSPFQSEVSHWLLDHLLVEGQWCQQYDKPMYFLGVGVNDARALKLPQTRRIVGQAEHIWTRDAASAQALVELGGWDKVSLGADLAHLYLQQYPFAESWAGSLGFVLNFEYSEAFSAQALYDTLDGLPDWHAWWLAQEVRPIPGAEMALFASLAPEYQQHLDVRVPHYETGRLPELVSTWGVPEVLVTSRYHGALLGAWMGCRVLAVTRNRKVEGAVSQLGLSRLPDFTSATDMIAGVQTCAPVARTTLYALAELASLACDSFFTACRYTARAKKRTIPSLPRRALRKLRSVGRRVTSSASRTVNQQK